ncbi:hypothetical protein SEUCBS139899_000502 [Sporothrix eucalyptigena]
MAYPNHSSDGTDDESSAVVADRMVRITDALHNPSVCRPDGEWRGVEVARQFWSYAKPLMRLSTATRFLDTFEAYLGSMVTEAADRETGSKSTQTPVYTFESYIELRRKTVGAWPSYVLMELAMHDLSEDSVTQAVTSQDMHELAVVVTDMILIGNDLVSYNKERPSGAVHNLVSVVLSNPLMPDEWSTTPPSFINTVQDAIDWVAAHHDILTEKFFCLYAKFTAEDASPAARRYAYGLGNWVRANDAWSFESFRYFGARGLEVQKNRTVELLPLGK